MLALPPDAPASPPDWDAIAHEVLCPLCDYNLRGLSDPRCPECGGRFNWADVTDPEKRLHPYLFEHHPERSFGSFFQTLVGTLRPKRFWSSLSPTHPLRPVRLRLYALLTALLASLAFFAEFARAIFTWWRTYRGTPVLGPEFPFSWGHVWDTAAVAWQRDRLLGLTFSQLLFWLAWPWLMLLALQVFRASMRRAKVKSGHVLRCVAYSFDVGAWLGLAGVAWAGYGVASNLSAPAAWLNPSHREFENRAAGFLLLTVVLVTARMWRAYRTYMRFDHALGTVISAQVIVLLIALNWLLAWENWIQRSL